MIVGERFGYMIKTMLLKVSRFVNSAHSSIIYSPPSESIDLYCSQGAVGHFHTTMGVVLGHLTLTEPVLEAFHHYSILINEKINLL